MICSRVPVAHRRVRRRPVDHIDRHRAGQLQCRMMRFRRQRDDQVEIIVLEFFQRLRLVAPSVSPISSSTASTKGSRSPRRTPAEAI